MLRLRGELVGDWLLAGWLPGRLPARRLVAGRLVWNAGGTAGSALRMRSASACNRHNYAHIAATPNRPLRDTHGGRVDPSERQPRSSSVFHWLPTSRCGYTPRVRDFKSSTSLVSVPYGECIFCFVISVY